MAIVNFARGLKPASVANLDANTLYFFTNTNEIYLGSTPYSGDLSDILGDIAALETWQETIDNWKDGYTDGESVTHAGAEDRIQALESGTVQGVTAADASVTVDNTDAQHPEVAVRLSAITGNALELANDGLKVVIPAATDYSVHLNTLGGNEDYAQRYQITQGEGAGTEIGVINIPKDMVVQSGTVVTLTEPDKDGHAAGTYIKLILQNATNDEIWIAVDDLIEYVTSGSQAGDQIMVAVSSDHKVTATLSNGSVTKAQLVQSVQDTLDAADTALQASDLAEGTNNGETLVDGTSKSIVKGLSSAAFTESTAYATAAQGTTADNAYAALTWIELNS